jgi:ketosteroid isomerase-like protein
LKRFSWLVSVVIIQFVIANPFTAVGQDAATGPGSSGTADVSGAGAENPTHDRLRQLRADLESAVNQGEWEQLLGYLTPNVIVTWLDGTQSRGHDEVLEYLQSKTTGEQPIVERFSLTTEVKELSDLYGDDTAIAFGAATSAFVLRGRELTVTGPWSATMVRDGDTWKIASAHASIGAFDNPLLLWTWRLVWIVSIVAAVVGVLVGWLIGRRKKAVATSG